MSALEGALGRVVYYPAAQQIDSCRRDLEHLQILAKKALKKCNPARYHTTAQARAETRGSEKRWLPIRLGLGAGVLGVGERGRRGETDRGKETSAYPNDFLNQGGDVCEFASFLFFRALKSNERGYQI